MSGIWFLLLQYRLVPIAALMPSVVGSDPSILLESGDYLLLESGDNLLLE